jgi:formylglycine-generating enzyme required for sulfatase activity/tRNA A-37 threonylcarbamoyl transferase component Bud32
MTSSAAQDPDSLIGRTVERYRIERELGRGAMGVVYEACHEELAKRAAVKTILPHALADDVARSRFVREATALGRVKSPGLVDIYNVGNFESGSPYILMELLEGPTLSEHLKQTPGGKLAVAESLRLVQQLASTLAELHHKGVVHRDLKPDNIKLVSDLSIPGGVRTKILDLGIAKLLGEAAATQASVPGTPLYMSPEACEGRSVTGQADVYSLGCVLFELLCGRPPFIGEAASVITKRLFQSPPSPRQFVPDLPRPVSELVCELLTRDPEARPSAAQVESLLARLAANPNRGSWRRRWLRRKLKARGAGMWLAYRLGMPLLLLGFLAWLASDWMVRTLPWLASSRVGRIMQTEMVRLPGGPFVRGSSEADLESARSLARDLDREHSSEAHAYMEELVRYLEREKRDKLIHVSPFAMDRYEVTNEEFLDFLRAQHRARRIKVLDICPGAKVEGTIALDYQCVWKVEGERRVPYKSLYTEASFGGIKFYGDDFVLAKEYRRFPVVAVSWLAAKEFCVHHGKRLPTEAEWEYAARLSGLRFPWGDRQPRCADAVLERSSKGPFSHCRTMGASALLPVGSMRNDQTKEGIHDLAGSVQEWTSDLFVESGEGNSGQVTDDPYRVIRGGSWTDSFVSARPTGRYRLPQNRLNAAVGFRCVRDLK